MPFFYYSQNNSGGNYRADHNAGISAHVIIEADDAEHANYRAGRIGLYFDGRGDCHCCGNRWYEKYTDEDGEAVPSIHSDAIQDFEFRRKRIKDGPEAYVHFKDGTVQGYGLEPKRLTT